MVKNTIDIIKIICWLGVVLLIIYSADHFRDMVMDFRLEKGSIESELKEMKRTSDLKIYQLEQQNERQQMQIDVLLRRTKKY